MMVNQVQTVKNESLELLRLNATENRYSILGVLEAMNDSFETVLLENGQRICGLVYYSNGIEPQFSVVEKIDSIFVGFENSIARVNLKTKNILFDLQLPSTFYEFIYVDKLNLVVISCELDVFVIQHDGEKRWSIGLTDIVNEFRIKDEKSIYVTCDDGNEFEFNIMDGSLIS